MKDLKKAVLIALFLFCFISFTSAQQSQPTTVENLDNDNDGVINSDEGYHCVKIEKPLTADGTFDSIQGSLDRFNSNVTGAGWINDGGTADTWDCPVPNTGTGKWGGLADGMPCSPQGGTFAAARAEVRNYGEGFSTIVDDLVIGTEYEVSFYQANAGTEGRSEIGDLVRWKITFGPDTQLSPSMPYLGEGNQVWEKITLTFVAAETSQKLTFRGEHAEDGGRIEDVDNMAADDVKVKEKESLTCSGRDTDDDGIPDHLDLDSDNDGISDLFEASQIQAYDQNLDGVLDDLSDQNENGISDYIESIYGIGQGIPPKDTDEDGFIDTVDLDSDEDGIPDTIEALETYPYQNNDGDVRDDDIDRDGVISLFDLNPDFGGSFSIPVNTDQFLNNKDLLFDYVDLDSDGDGLSDVDEKGVIIAQASYIDPNGTINHPLIDLKDDLIGNQEVAYREFCTTPNLPDIEDQTVCDSYRLPPISEGQYFSKPNGLGTPLKPGDLITSNQTIYLYSTVGQQPICTAEKSFKINVNRFLKVATIGDDQQFCQNGNSKPIVEKSETLATGVLTYQWQSSQDGIQFTDLIGEQNRHLGSQLVTQRTWFRRLDTSQLNDLKCQSFTNSVIIEPIGLESFEISESQTICNDENIQPLTDRYQTDLMSGTTHQWEKSNDSVTYQPISGATSRHYTPPHSQDDFWFRRIDYFTENGVMCDRTSVPVKLTFIRIDNNEIIGDQTTCIGETNNFIGSIEDTSSNAIIQYQWQKSIDNDQFVTMTGQTDKALSVTIEQTTWFRRIDIASKNNLECRLVTNSVKVEAFGFESIGTIGHDQISCDSTLRPLEEISHSKGIGQLRHQWQKSFDGQQFTDIPMAEQNNYLPKQLLQTTWFRRKDDFSLNENSCIGYTNAVKITKLPAIELPIPNLILNDCNHSFPYSVLIQLDQSKINGGLNNIVQIEFIGDGNTPNDPSDDQMLQTGQSFQYLKTNLEQEHILIKVTDQSGCSQSTSIEIPERQRLSGSVKLINQKNCVEDTASFEIDIFGGTPPYFAGLDQNNLIESKRFFDQITDLNHDVFIEDSQGCRFQFPINLQEGIDLDADIHVIHGCDNHENSVEVEMKNKSIQGQLTFRLNGQSNWQNKYYNLNPGTHQLTIEHENGCQNNLSFNISTPEPLLLDLNQQQLNTIRAKAEGGTGPYLYQLNDLGYHRNNEFMIKQSGNYTISVKDQNGCIRQQTLFLEFLDIKIPNYFTPNGDGIHDGWKPYHLDDYPEAEIRIYDRYGRLIQQLKINEYWTGEYNGEQLPTGDYWYVIKLNRMDNDQEIMGNFSLMR